MKRKGNGIRAEEGSANVFGDLDLPHAEQELLRARLTLQIYQLIKARGLTQAKAGEILGIKQPHVSALMRNRSSVRSRRSTRGRSGGWDRGPSSFFVGLDHLADFRLRPAFGEVPGPGVVEGAEPGQDLGLDAA